MFRLIRYFCLSLFFLSAVAQAQSLRDVFTNLADGTPVPNSPTSTLIMGGITDRLTTESSELSISAQDRVTLTGLLSRAATRAAVGGSYSDPDLSQSVGDQISGMQLYAASGELAFQSVGCGDVASELL
ncbi:hypothetical protein [Gymnodinialimonas ulvae]|uniref:hypothetical protein n=1 Tax=Gymnodinialimonas ulvae TaxID=3126504 RepID=UPI0030AFDAC1